MILNNFYVLDVLYRTRKLQMVALHRGCFALMTILSWKLRRSSLIQSPARKSRKWSLSGDFHLLTFTCLADHCFFATTAILSLHWEPLKTCHFILDSNVCTS